MKWHLTYGDRFGESNGFRHRGRRRPLKHRRLIFPEHCACNRAHWGIIGGSFWNCHVVRTVAPQ